MLSNREWVSWAGFGTLLIAILLGVLIWALKDHADECASYQKSVLAVVQDDPEQAATILKLYTAECGS